ncbi:MAG: hypothetical protein J5590_02240 [Clostridia bacterium]|nr:hypothetical protein [Clostridia bacterium]
MSIKHVGSMTVAAHRGDSYNYYENTMTAYKKAIECGSDMIETDVHLTADGVLVLIHDHKVDRTTNGKGDVAGFTYEELKKLNAGDTDNPEEIPLFESLLELLKDTEITLNIEIKEYFSKENEQRCVKCIEDVIALVEKYNMGDRILLNSFDAWVLEYVYKKYGKKYMLHGFYPYDIMSNVSLNPDDYLYCACIFDDMNKDLYDYLSSKNIETWIGAGVTQEGLLGVCAKLGAKLVTTNNPKDALEKLKRLGLR